MKIKRFAHPLYSLALNHVTSGFSDGLRAFMSFGASLKAGFGDWLGFLRTLGRILLNDLNESIRFSRGIDMKGHHFLRLIYLYSGSRTYVLSSLLIYAFEYSSLEWHNLNETR
jgi:hypothetical protein